MLGAMRGVRRILGGIGLERGRGNEKRVLEACQLPTRPKWMLEVRRGTRAEDHAGIDLVIESDVGKLFVQVKSSRRGKADFEEKRRSARVAVVIVRAGDSQEQILSKVVSAVAPLRKEFLGERAEHADAARPKRKVLRAPSPAADEPVPDAEWVRLRDHLLAVLVAPGARAVAIATDDALRASMDALAAAQRAAALPRAPVDAIVARFPDLFGRDDAGGVTARIGRTEAYALRLRRVWDLVPRDVLRRALVRLAEAFGECEAGAAVELSAVLASAIARSDGTLTDEEVRPVAHLLLRAGAWTSVRGDDGKPRVRPADWARYAPAAEERIEAAAAALMGPFAPVDRAALTAALDGAT
jgi:hypothetical protein